MAFVSFPTKIKYIEQLSDMPTPSGGIITQPNNTAWSIIGTVDIGANRIVMGQDSVIHGEGPKNSVLTCSNAGALITTTSNAFFYDIRFTNTGAGTIFSCNGTGLPGLSKLLFNNIEIDNSRIGTLQNYQIIHHEQCVYTNLLGGVTIDGTLGSVSYSNFLLTTVTSGVTCITFPSTAVIGSRIRLINGGFNVVSGATAINTSTSATIPTEAFQGQLLNFVGAGTMLTGVQTSDVKSFFLSCRGVSNSAFKGQVYMVNNATATAIGVAGTYVKASGTTTSASLERFTATANRLTYTGGVQETLLVFAMGSFTTTNGNECGFKLYKNGVAIPETEVLSTGGGAGVYTNYATQCFVNLTTNDYIELWCTNLTATNSITVRSLNLAINKT